MHSSQRIHFIAIGGSVMHNLAIALKEKGYKVTGSDDDIFEPSRSRLEKAGILPPSNGWDPNRVTEDLDAVVLGMHAKADNPELIKAQELGLKIYSYPDFIFENIKDKQRIVIAGSHGKTTITSMVLHVLKYHNRAFDYVVGAQIEGFDNMVKLSDAPIIVIEGDEYLTSPLDRTPKFLKYQHHIGLISGIEWDHINVYPTLEDYVKQFDHFADATPKAGTLIYCEEDDMATLICNKEREDVQRVEYKEHPSRIENGTTYLLTENGEVPVKVFGRHNMQNLSGAKEVLKKVGVTSDQFYEAIQTFKGAANRLELLKEKENHAVYKDFAHAPSKLAATTKALKDQYKDRQLVACLELYTFSSLNKAFLSQYQSTFNAADIAIVYYSPKNLVLKNLETFSAEDVKLAFNRSDLLVFTEIIELKQYLMSIDWNNKNLLMMSSGKFDGLDLHELTA
jgi:UDP-N-acetylmuramate: L-alanyl-gamma-D-glutamyl-meso-diaminopimelate ligase